MNGVRLSQLCVVALCVLTALPVFAQNPVPARRFEAAPAADTTDARDLRTVPNRRADRLRTSGALGEGEHGPPFRFVRGTDSLTTESRVRLDEQAWMIANQPSAHIRYAVGAGRSGTLASIRAWAMADVLRAWGVAPWQVSFERPSPDDRSETARVVSIEGLSQLALTQVSFHVVAWPGAEVFSLPSFLVERQSALPCYPPERTRLGRANLAGRLETHHPRTTVVLVGRDADRLVTLTHRTGDDPQPIDLASQVHDPRCDDAP